MMLVAALLGPLLLSGCPGECTGVGCAESYSAALIGVHPGHDPLPRSTNGLSPLLGPFFVDGTASQGPNWDLVVRTGTLIVGVPAADQVRLYAEADAGLSSVALRGDRAGDAFGAGIAALPDLDLDGVQTLAVSAPLTDRDDTTRDNGAVYLFDDPLLRAGEPALTASDAPLTLRGRSAGGRFGEVLAGCGDMSGDGAPELAIGAPVDDGEDDLAGTVTLVLSEALDRREIDADTLPTRWSGQRLGAHFGAALSCAADLTGDGLADLLVAAPFDGVEHDGEGVVTLLPGGALPPEGRLDPTQVAYFAGRSANQWLGWSMATGDLDGDGRAEIALGAPGADNGRGAVSIWRIDDLPAVGPVGFPAVRILGIDEGDAAGTAVAIADLDGDGFDELLIGAPKRNPTLDQDPAAFESGALYIFRGSAGLSTLRPVLSAEEADLVYETEQAFLRTGKLIRVGDFDGDSLADLVLLHQNKAED